MKRIATLVLVATILTPTLAQAYQEHDEPFVTPSMAYFQIGGGFSMYASPKLSYNDETARTTFYPFILGEFTLGMHEMRRGHGIHLTAKVGVGLSEAPIGNPHLMGELLLGPMFRVNQYFFMGARSGMVLTRFNTLTRESDHSFTTTSMGVPFTWSSFIMTTDGSNAIFKVDAGVMVEEVFLNEMLDSTYTIRGMIEISVGAHTPPFLR